MALEFEIGALAALIGLSGFFSGLEVALVGTSQATVEQLVKEKRRGSKALHKLKSNPGWMMSSVNLGNNLVNVGSSALATVVAIEMFGNEGLGIAVGIMTFLIIIFGEVTPKTYCNANATKVALGSSGILLTFSYALYPIVWILERITRVMIKITGSGYHPPALTEEEIKGIIDQGHRDDALEVHERDLVHRALNFDDIVIRAVMTPRTKMIALDGNMTIEKALSKINKTGHSRFPIYNKNNDDIVGIIHVKDMLQYFETHSDKSATLMELSREPVFVSQEKLVSELFKEMQVKKSHLAIVVDEFGGVEGCVTLEDLLEEIVGEIEDETDIVKTNYQWQNNTLITDGDIEIDTLNDLFKSDIPSGDDYSTLNGLLHEKLHDIPAEGDIVTINTLKITVKKVHKNKPTQIIIERSKK